jgi:hypothetical protein
MKRLVEAAIEKAVRQVWIGLSTPYLVCASFEVGNIRIEVLPPKCARAKQVLKTQTHKVLGYYSQADVAELRNDLKVKAKESLRAI